MTKERNNIAVKPEILPNVSTFIKKYEKFR